MEFGSQVLFENINYVINKRDKIALVGKNGAGKTTMLKIIAGEQLPTSGTVARQSDITIGYLPQQMKLIDTLTVKQEAERAFEHLQQMDAAIDRMNQELADRTDYDSEEYHDLIDRVTQKTELRALMQSENMEAEIEKTLTGLGFERSDFERPTHEFSGGWRMRIELAKLLLRRPDVLLLDEPTNHLDIESIQWLESFLKNRNGALLLVSHDRAFIDNVTNRTIEISLGKIYDYKVSYSQFVELRKERVEQQMRAYENQQKLIHDTEDFIERFRYKATKAVQVQSRIKMLDKLERIEVDEVDRSRMRLKFPPAPRSGDYPVIVEDLRKDYGSLNVFHDVTFTIKRGEKVAFVGKNGAGKSTLVKCIMGEIPFDGKLQIGHNVKIGYFAQNQAQLLDETLTVHDTIDYVAVGDIRTRINDILGAFMFGGKNADKKVKVLSGGEKSRLAMIRLLLQPVNLLILDEPTNHLDMPSKDVLKEAIKACKEVCPEAKIVIHTELHNYNMVKSFYSMLLTSYNSIPYDIIGLSYYPEYHGTVIELESLLNYLEQNFSSKETIGYALRKEFKEIPAGIVAGTAVNDIISADCRSKGKISRLTRRNGDTVDSL